MFFHYKIFSNRLGLITVFFLCYFFTCSITETLDVPLLTIQNFSIIHKGYSYQIMTIMFLYLLSLIIIVKLKYFKVLTPRAGIYSWWHWKNNECNQSILNLQLFVTDIWNSWIDQITGDYDTLTKGGKHPCPVSQGLIYRLLSRARRRSVYSDT